MHRAGIDSVDLDIQQPPFDLLDEDAAEALRASADIVYFAESERPLTADQPSDAVYVLVKGRVMAFDQRDGVRQPFADYGPGDLMGAHAVLMGRARHTYEVIEDCICHALPADVFRRTAMAHASFAAYFRAGLSAKRRLSGERDIPPELARRMLTRAGDVRLGPLVWVDADLPIAKAVKHMREARATCVMVRPDADAGIVTRTDMLDALALERMPPDTPLTALVRRPLITVDAAEVLFQALVTMIDRHVERVVVTEDGRPCGTLGITEVLSHYSSQSHLVLQAMDAADSVDELARAAAGVAELVRGLFQQGAKTSFLMGLVSAINRRMLRRLHELLLAPEWRERITLLVLGSEGRSEQILRTDQDNALIHDEGAGEEAVRYADALFGALAAAGFPPCPGEVMARNPHWRATPAQWARRVSEWGADADPEALMELAMLADARVVSGPPAALEPVREALRDLGRDQIRMHHFAQPAIAFHTPLSLFGHLREDAEGLDVKKGGVFPLVHGLRALAVASGLEETNSFRRADALIAKGVLRQGLGDDVKQALAVLIRLRLAQQLDDLARGGEAGNHLRVSSMRRLDRELLRDALRVVNDFKLFLQQRFHLGD